MHQTTETLVIERAYAQPPERVFAAWTDIALLRRWFGCSGGILWTLHEWDARPGGKLHVSLDCDGTPYDVFGEFVRVEAPHLLTYTWNETDTIEVTIAPKDSGSLVRLAHTFPAGEGEKELRGGGWSAALDLLAAI
jgi:uncharacterized protein YndB with AHSA1/START domain